MGGSFSQKEICTIQRASIPLHHQSNAEIAQLVEHDLAKVGVAGPSPVFRSKPLNRVAFLFFSCRSHDGSIQNG